MISLPFNKSKENDNNFDETVLSSNNYAAPAPAATVPETPASNVGTETEVIDMDATILSTNNNTNTESDNTMTVNDDTLNNMPTITPDTPEPQMPHTTQATAQTTPVAPLIDVETPKAPTLEHTDEDTRVPDDDNKSVTIRPIKDLAHNEDGTFNAEVINERDKEWNAVLSRVMASKDRYKVDADAKAMRVKNLEDQLSESRSQLDKMNEISKSAAASYDELKRSYDEQADYIAKLEEQTKQLAENASLADKVDGVGAVAGDIIRRASTQAEKIRSDAEAAAKAREEEARKNASDIIESAAEIKTNAQDEATKRIADAQDEAATIIQHGTAEAERRIAIAKKREDIVRKFVKDALEATSTSMESVKRVLAETDNVPGQDAQLSFDNEDFGSDAFNAIEKADVNTGKPAEKSEESEDSPTVVTTVNPPVNDTLEEEDTVEDEATNPAAK